MAILSRCGYRCDLCQAYKENIAAQDQRRRVQALWGKYYGIEADAEDIGCDGCLSAKADAELADSNCPVRPCAIAKGVAHCGQCPNYPCGHIRTRIGLSAAAAREKLGDAFNQEEFDQFLLAYDNQPGLDAAAKEATLQALSLRRENAADYRETEALTREAFWNNHVPGCDEHYLLHVMRDAESFIPKLDYVAVLGDKIIGHIAYTHARIITGDGASHPALSFGPLSVLPAYQSRGVGGALIRHTLALARDMGHQAVLIYGDPAYYCRFGFAAAEQYGIRTSAGLYHAALQAYALVPGALSGLAGRFEEDAVYQIDSSAAAEFDKSFPAKEKSTAPSQARFQELLKQCHE